MSPRGSSLITGASSGIGEAFARALAARGSNLILVARSKDKLQRLAGELSTRHGVEAVPLPFDLSEPQAARKLAETLRAQRLDVEMLINNAGFGGRGEFWNLPLDRQAEMFRLNAEAVVDLTHALLPPMIERRFGGVIYVSSITGFQPIPYAGLYAATKAFVTSFSMALSEELRPYGIRVVTLCPGGTRTSFYEIGERGKASFPGNAQAPAEVVRAALNGLDRGGGMVVPRFSNKLTVSVQRLLPRTLVPRIIARMSRP
jgi:uncharacterized protein